MTILVNAFEAMKVNVESSVGKGTRFHLELPPSRAGGEKPA
jgi:signal transduction histidine kinase